MSSRELKGTWVSLREALVEVGNSREALVEVMEEKGLGDQNLAKPKGTQEN